MNFAKPSLAVGLLVVLAACEATIITKSRIHAIGTNSTFIYAAAGRDFRIEVANSPLPGQRATIEKMTTEAFQRGYPRADTRFTTTPGNALGPYKIVLAFNPSNLTTPGDICAGGDRLEIRPTAKTVAVAVFCGAEPLAEITGTIPRVDSLADGRLQGLLDSIAWRLIPEDRISDSNE